MQSVHLYCQPCKTFYRGNSDVAVSILHIPGWFFRDNICPIGLVDYPVLCLAPSTLAFTYSDGPYTEIVDVSYRNALNSCRIVRRRNIRVGGVVNIMAAIANLPLCGTAILRPPDRNIDITTNFDILDDNITHIRALYHMFTSKDGIAPVDIAFVGFPSVPTAVINLCHALVQCCEQISNILFVKDNRRQQREPGIGFDEGRCIRNHRCSLIAYDTHRHFNTIAVFDYTGFRVSDYSAIIAVSPLLKTTCSITVRNFAII